MNHDDIRSASGYAHVLDDAVADALERVCESRILSRTGLVRSR